MISKEYLLHLLGNVGTLGVVCNQWGDTGKGKFVDYFASEWAEIVARGTGGANAGHTIRVGKYEIILHLIPAGILHPKVVNIIGSGVAVAPWVVVKELALLEEASISTDNLRIALNAHLVLPQHIVLDRVREASRASGKIGTTGRGIGPVYADHAARTGLVVNDMLNRDVFIAKFRRNAEEAVRVLRGYDPGIVREVVTQENPDFYNPDEIFDVAVIAKYYASWGQKLRPFITDTDEFMRKQVGKKRILLEGAQGNLLSVDYGIHPHVTSSDCSIQGLAKGVGIRERDVDFTLGIAKAFYMTRVGEGPFPTELGGEASARHCRTATRKSEEELSRHASLDAGEDFMRGIAVRRIGDEYGATTGRPRRTGWLDLPLLRYSVGITGPNVILTKLDVLDGIRSFKICTEYEYSGPIYNRGDKVFHPGDKIRVAIPDLDVLRYCRPVYQEFPGWKDPIRDLRAREEVPGELASAVRFVEREADVTVNLLSVGPDREETILW